MEKKRRIPVKSFETIKEFREFIDIEKDWMYNKIYEGIEEAFYNGEDQADILDAKIEENMKLVSMKSDKSEWIKSLSLAIDWYESNEMYENCARFLNLVEKIKDN